MREACHLPGSYTVTATGEEWRVRNNTVARADFSVLLLLLVTKLRQWYLNAPPRTRTANLRVVNPAEFTSKTMARRTGQGSVRFGGP